MTNTGNNSETEILRQKAAELVIANKELAFQNEEKEKRAAELVIANKELTFQNEEKEKRAAELEIANKELVFQNGEKEKRAAELVIINEARRETNEYLENLINYANAPIIVWNTQFEITRFNKAFESLTGRTEKEVLGKSLKILFPSDSRDSSMELIRKTLEGDRMEVVEINIRHIDGSVRILLWNSANIMSRDGKTILATIAQGHNITRRKQAEEALLESENHYHDLVEQTRDIIFSLSPQGLLTSLNQAFEHITGLQMQEWLGKPVIDLLHPEDISLASERFSNILKGYLAEPIELHLRKKSGDYVLCEILASPLVKNEMIIGLQGISRDITERKQAEEELKESQIMLHDAQKLAHIAVWNWKADSNSVIWNEELYQIAGLDPMLPAPTFEDQSAIYTPQSWHVLKIAIEKAMKTGEPYQLELELTRPDGNIRNIVAFGGAKFDNKGRISGLYGTVQDITKRKEAEEELRLAKDKAEESDRLKSAFLANMSHEIRTPLNAIVGFSSFFSDPDLSQEDKVKFSEIINSRSNDLLIIINDILDISRIESGNITIVKKQVLVNDILDEMEENFHLKLSQINKTNLQLICEKTLPTDQSGIITDENIVKRVFSNLIDNAIKFTESGTIRFGYHMPDNHTLTCYISDTGIGISAENQKVIFEHFRQAAIENPQKLYGGSGLGLSICKGFLELLGGKIWVESIPWEGSTFYFTIPFDQPPAQKTEPIRKHDNKPSGGIPDWAGKKFLLVEDDQANMNFLTLLLKHTGAEVVYAYSGKDVRQQFDHLDTIDLVLLDIRLPDAIGWDLAREIKTLRPGLNIITQTAYAMSSDKQKSEEAGCNGFISKPFRQSEFYQIIAELMAV